MNLNHLPDEVADAIVRCGLRSMTCSIDGASEATYQQYRVRGSFDRVIANVRKINRCKREYESEFPHLIWQFVAFGHNEHEIVAARALASELNMEFRVKLTWTMRSHLFAIRNRCAPRAASERRLAMNSVA